MMTATDLAKLAREVDEAQQRYFRKGRSQADLEASKAAEKRLRAAVAEILDPPTLKFGRDE